MILLEQQVCSLELATKLKQLGIEQKSLFYWAKFFYLEGKSHQWGVESKEQNELEVHEYGHTKIEDVENYSAFTVAELGEMLPARIRNEKTGNLDFLRMHKGDDSRQDVRDNFTAEYHTTFEPPLCRITADSEANCRAKMLIYLIEHNLYDLQTQKTQN